MKVVGSVMEGIAAKRAGNYNRDVAYNDAINMERDGTYDESLMRDKARMAIGEQIASQGEGGFALGTGSALDALRQSEIQSTLDILVARRRVASEAGARRTQGDIARRAGKTAFTASMVRAAGEAIDYAAKAAGGGG